MAPKTFRQQIEEIDAECLEIALAKNHDYGDAWREMRPSSITDQILVKVRRIQRLEDLAAQGLTPLVSEGIVSELRDIHNYATLELIKLLSAE